jgi:hypothetical protein
MSDTNTQVTTTSNPSAHEVKKVEPENTTGSSIFSVNPQTVKAEQFKMPTWGLISTLVVAFFILKFFIYIKDTKRHGK